MKIELELPDVRQAAKVINNAAAAYGRICFAAMIGCEVPDGFRSLYELEDDELTAQIDLLTDIVRQLDDILK